jgi:hypothetical protein
MSCKSGNASAYQMAARISLFLAAERLQKNTGNGPMNLRIWTGKKYIARHYEDIPPKAELCLLVAGASSNVLTQAVESLVEAITCKITPGDDVTFWCTAIQPPKEYQ